MSEPTIIRICMGTSCFSRGNEENLNLLEDYVIEHNLDDKLELVGCDCTKACEFGPNITIGDRTYGKMTPEKLLEILDERFGAGADKKQNEH